jgi:hypothetical protein
MEFSLSVWSYHFYVFIDDEAQERHIRRSAIAKRLKEKNARGAIKLSKRGEVIAHASPVTFLDVAEDSPVFRNQVRLAREQKAARERSGAGTGDST